MKCVCPTLHRRGRSLYRKASSWLKKTAAMGAKRGARDCVTDPPLSQLSQ